MFASSGDTDVTHWRLELNERMCLIVGIGRAGFAVGAEISIMTNSALVSLANDIPRTTLS
jgi:hypothetical protein